MVKHTRSLLLLIVACLTPCLAGEPGKQTVAPPAGVYSVLAYGAEGDGQTSDTAAIQRAVDACAAAGGGRVSLPGGHTYLSGSISLKAPINFHLERGAVLKATQDWREYGENGCLLFAKDADSIRSRATD